MELKFEKKDVMIYVLIILVVLLLFNSFNQRNDILSGKREEKKYQDKIENYKNQIEGVQFYAKGLEKKINTKDGQIDSVRNISEDNLNKYLRLKKKLNEITPHYYADISDDELISKLSAIKFNTTD